MADSFTSIKLGGQVCIQADPSLYPAAAKLANGYWCPLGPEPGVAHVLMRRGDLELLDLNTALTLEIKSGKTLTVPSLYFINCVAVSQGPALNANRIYMLKLADPRYLLKKFGGTINKGYNVRSYVSLRDPSDTATNLLPEDCYTESLDAGALWTWATMFEDIWDMLPNVGAFPGLPATPDGDPENFHFTGESTWAALNALLDLVHFAISYNPATNLLSIVDLRAAQSGLFNSLKALGTPLIDLAPFAGTAAQYPATVTAHYPESTTQYGALNDTPLGSNYLFSAETTEDSATGKAGAIAGTKVDLYDNRAMRTDDETSPLTSRTANTTQRKNDWLARQNTSETYAHVEYQGIVNTIATGSQVKSVYWHSWGNGTRTEIARFPGMPSAHKNLYLPEPMPHGELETLNWLDVARKSKPIYPHVMQWVRLYTGTPNSEGFYEAQIVRLNAENGTPATVDDVAQDDVFVWFEDDGRWSDHKKVPRLADSLVLARFAGSIKTGGEVRPLLVAQENVITAIGKIAGTFPGTAGQATINVWSGAFAAEAVVTGLDIIGYPWSEANGGNLSTGAKVVAKYVSGVWYYEPAPSAPLQGRAKTNWKKQVPGAGNWPSRSGSPGSEVYGYVEVDNVIGESSTATTYRVYIPTKPPATVALTTPIGDEDPNVVEDQTVTFMQIGGRTDPLDGTKPYYETIGSGYTSASIGTVQLRFNDGTVVTPVGWRILDGTEDATKNGIGIQVDMTDYFPRGNQQASTTTAGGFTIPATGIAAALQSHTTGSKFVGSDGTAITAAPNGETLAHNSSGTDIAITEANSRPKSRGVYWYVRYDNAAN
jgi:hypothetical protein